MAENDHYYSKNGSKKLNNQDYINGIHCDVENCTFHAPDCKCCADKIQVGPTFANDSSETVCATFMQK